jgi:hypothetical protein
MREMVEMREKILPNLPLYKKTVGAIHLRIAPTANLRCTGRFRERQEFV